MANLKATDFAGLDKVLANRDARTIGHNTAARRDDGDIVVSLHGNDIVRLSPDGSVAATFAGWPTVTTADRIAQFLVTSEWGLCRKGDSAELRYFPRPGGQYAGCFTEAADPSEWYRFDRFGRLVGDGERAA